MEGNSPRETWSKESMTDTPEKSALGHIPPKKRTVKPSLPKTAMSLKPGMQLMDLLTLPKPTERVLAIQDAWKFRFPVTQSDVYVESTPEIIFAASRWYQSKDTTGRGHEGSSAE
jgi:hypothetical protein